MPKFAKFSWVILAAGFMLPSIGEATAPSPAPVEARILFPPTPFMGSDGFGHLAYEVQVSNVYDDSGTLNVSELDVLDEENRRLLHLNESDLAASFRPAVTDGKRVSIGPGKTGTFFIWITLPPGVAPKTLHHKLLFANVGGKASEVDGLKISISPPSSRRLGPPLRGGRWLAHEGPGNARSHHWGSLVAVNGFLTIPQRYAIDFVRIDADGRAFKPVKDLHATKLTDWFGFGTEVLSVGNGSVVAARDGQEDHAPLVPQPEPDALSLDGLFGNYVVIDLGDGVFAAYAHLREGSIRVTAGQQVKIGQVIGELGESGSSAAPHLHFQLSNAATFEESQGLPYVFDRLNACGMEKEDQLFGLGEPWVSSPCKPADGTLPMNDTVVEWPKPAF